MTVDRIPRVEYIRRRRSPELPKRILQSHERRSESPERKSANLMIKLNEIAHVALISRFASDDDLSGEVFCQRGRRCKKLMTRPSKTTALMY